VGAHTSLVPDPTLSNLSVPGAATKNPSDGPGFLDQNSQPWIGRPLNAHPDTWPFDWLFSAPPRTGVWQAVVWWELRRLPVNLLVGVYGILCLVVFYWSIMRSHVLAPGEDAVELLQIVVAPIAFNLAYTFGWLVEGAARLLFPALTPRFGPRLLAAGLAFSALLISLPAVYWLGYWLLMVRR
jgi:hypothetical protein